MKRLFWSIGMAVTLALAIFILSSPSKGSWTFGAEANPASVKVNPQYIPTTAPSNPK